MHRSKSCRDHTHAMYTPYIHNWTRQPNKNWNLFSQVEVDVKPVGEFLCQSIHTHRQTTPKHIACSPTYRIGKGITMCLKLQKWRQNYKNCTETARASMTCVVNWKLSIRYGNMQWFHLLSAILLLVQPAKLEWNYWLHSMNIGLGNYLMNWSEIRSSDKTKK